MKIAIVVGTRPEIIKMAPVVRACVASKTPYLLLHTGQHYSFEMDGVFFQELGLPPAHHNLEVGSGTQVYQIGTILLGAEPLLQRERPDVLLVEGDTNSVLAMGLAAQKSGIPVGHVEAGLRSYDRGMPEEINRILTDHLSEYLFAPTEKSRQILLGEQIAPRRIHVTGNTVVDELLLQRRRAERPELFERFGIRSGAYALATVHRAENTDAPERLRGIFTGLAEAGRALGVPVLAALHPRTQARLKEQGVAVDGAVRILPPLPYLDFLGLHASAALTLTDSGGLQEEACTLGVPCVTLRDNTERPESVEVGANLLAGADPRRIVECARAMRERPRTWPNPFGDGHSGEKIVAILREALA
ncbi:MAG TPA: UDP-N-acetylglucosamine 2-epimerase (non-hydrolyzing) [Candidatus Sulfotelmatobacter sp.]|nr:UDP-N-acetylglucosamine 2-epimerase (non-hydrolyzing) [Candidatus Sulfotelmatobacter sp.]